MLKLNLDKLKFNFSRMRFYLNIEGIVETGH